MENERINNVIAEIALAEKTILELTRDGASYGETGKYAKIRDTEIKYYKEKIETLLKMLDMLTRGRA
jgi:DNA-binding CsgD family transcriptional regulator